MISKYAKILAWSFVLVVAVAVLGISVKGKKGEPIRYQSELVAEVGGPFENSGTTSRYALIQSLVDKGSFEFNLEQAKFASPDVVFYKDKYFTIFTPGVSFALAPGYYLGKLVGFPQLATFMLNTVFAVLNMALVYYLGRRFGASTYASAIGSLIYMFGTNALVYAQTITQHHLSTAVILLSVLNASERRRTWYNNAILGVLMGLGVLFDFPNPLMLIPVVLYVFYRHSDWERLRNTLKVRFNVSLVAIFIGALPFIFLYGFYNKELTGSYTTIGQFIGRSAFGEQKYNTAPPSQSDILIKASSPLSIKTPFQTRKQIQGLYILMLSDERSWIFYSPVVLVGVLGLFWAIKEQRTRTLTMLAVSMVLFNILVYSVFGDPWGGWGFGPRYLLPAAAVLCAGIALTFERLYKNIVFLVAMTALIPYSVYISLLGANTTQSIPPKVEAVALASPIPHTFMRSQQLLEQGMSSSLIYSLWLEGRLHPQQLLWWMTLAVCLAVMVVYMMLLSRRK